MNSIENSKKNVQKNIGPSIIELIEKNISLLVIIQTIYWLTGFLLPKTTTSYKFLQKAYIKQFFFEKRVGSGGTLYQSSTSVGRLRKILIGKYKANYIL